MSEDEKLNFNDTEDDEIVVIKLPRNEANTLRDMIQRQQVMSWLWKWITAFFLVFASGLITLFTFGSTIKGALKAWLGN